MEIIELTTVSEMLDQIETLNHLYPQLTLEKYESYLQQMVPHNYKQLAVFEGQVCIGLTGFWSGYKLWSGKYIEIDNFVVHTDYRAKGVGKLMTDYIDDLAKSTNCTMIVLDAFTGNFNAQRFYYKQGYEPRGFHFVKMLNEEGLT